MTKTQPKWPCVTKESSSRENVTSDIIILLLKTFACSIVAVIKNRYIISRLNKTTQINRDCRGRDRMVFWELSTNSYNEINGDTSCIWYVFGNFNTCRGWRGSLTHANGVIIKMFEDTKEVIRNSKP
jgi:hypothetical protein